MVQIGLNKGTGEIEIRIKVWALAQVIDSDNWQKVIYDECEKIILEELQKAKEKEKGAPLRGAPAPPNGGAGLYYDEKIDWLG